MLECPYCGKAFGSTETVAGHISSSHAEYESAAAEAELAPPAGMGRRVWRWFLRLLMKVCAFLTCGGLLWIVLGVVALFSSNGRAGMYLWQGGATVIVAGSMGALIWARLGSPEPEDW